MSSRLSVEKRGARETGGGRDCGRDRDGRKAGEVEDDVEATPRYSANHLKRDFAAAEGSPPMVLETLFEATGGIDGISVMALHETFNVSRQGRRPRARSEEPGGPSDALESSLSSSPLPL